MNAEYCEIKKKTKKRVEQSANRSTQDLYLSHKR